ncbi:MAG: hypothetical protein M3R04_00960, partial [bacterium]|nr:hypothetical protein [bacterium]
PDAEQQQLLLKQQETVTTLQIKLDELLAKETSRAEQLSSQRLEFKSHFESTNSQKVILEAQQKLVQEQHDALHQLQRKVASLASNTALQVQEEDDKLAKLSKKLEDFYEHLARLDSIEQQATEQSALLQTLAQGIADLRAREATSSELISARCAELEGKLSGALDQNALLEAGQQGFTALSEGLSALRAKVESLESQGSTLSNQIAAQLSHVAELNAASENQQAALVAQHEESLVELQVQLESITRQGTSYREQADGMWASIERQLDAASSQSAAIESQQRLLKEQQHALSDLQASLKDLSALQDQVAAVPELKSKVDGLADMKIQLESLVAREASQSEDVLSQWASLEEQQELTKSHETTLAAQQDLLRAQETAIGELRLQLQELGARQQERYETEFRRRVSDNKPQDPSVQPLIESALHIERGEYAEAIRCLEAAQQLSDNPKLGQVLALARKMHAPPEK